MPKHQTSLSRERGLDLPPPTTANVATKITSRESRDSLLGGNPTLDRDYVPFGGAPHGSSLSPAPTKYYRQDFEVPAGGYHDRQGMAPNAGGVSLKKSWLYIPNSLWTWSFFLIAFIQAAISLVLEA